LISSSKLDGHAKSLKTLFSDIPEKAVIQSLQGLLDSRLRGDKLRGSDDYEDFLRDYQAYFFQRSRKSFSFISRGVVLESKRAISQPATCIYSLR
jgi:hypothetical protein